MAIEDILKALDEQARSDVEAILDEANEHSKLILDEAERQAEQIHEGFARQVERVAKSDAAKKVNAARLEAKMIVSSVKGDGVADAFEDARGGLASVRGRSDYGTLFAGLAREALDGLDGPVVVHVAADDAGAAQAAAQEAGFSATVDATLDTTGGLIVEAHEGHVIRRNTLEDRLDRARQYVQADVARVLFS